MYRRVGSFSGSRELSELAPRLEPKKSELGYATTDRERTRELFNPILGRTFPGHWAHATLAIIWPNGTIHPHSDMLMDGLTRKVLVVQSNADAWCMVGGHWQQLEEGGIYQVDPRIRHASVNWGEELRMHFIVDVGEA